LLRAAGIEHRHGMAYDFDVFHLVTFLHQTPESLPNQEELSRA
jgi:hypothetical protein